MKCAKCNLDLDPSNGHRYSDLYECYYHEDCWPTPLEFFRMELIRNGDVGRLRELDRITKTQSRDYIYFVTWSRMPSVPLDQWQKAVTRELHKKWIVSFKAVCEHMNTNIHVHALCHSHYKKSHRDFKLFARKFGYVDIKQVQVDHGIDDYISKDQEEAKSAVITDPANLSSLFEPLPM